MSRLDEGLRVSPIRGGWIARTQVIDACASAWIAGDLVHEQEVLSAADSNGSETRNVARDRQRLLVDRRIFVGRSAVVLEPADESRRGFRFEHGGVEARE